jgi:hypothetical protein
MSEAGPSTVKKARKIDRSKSSKSSGARGVKKTRNADELVELEQALASYVRPPLLLKARGR